MKREFLTAPLRFALFFLVAVGLVVVLYGADRARKNQANQVIDWLPKGFQETQDFNWFLEHFYEGELLMFSWNDCAADDPSLLEIAKRLTSPREDGSPALFWKVMTTPEIKEDLTAKPISATDEEALERMQGWIVSRDGTQGCGLAFFSEEGYADVAGAVGLLRETVEEVAQIPASKLRLAGTSLDALAIDEASAESQAKLLPIFLAVCVVALFLLLGTWKAVFVVFVAAIFNEELSSALIYFCGSRADSISLLSASLMFTLTISGSLHLLNYYRDKMKREGKEGAVVGAMKRALIPCALSCLTTGMGLSSLALGKVAPIRKFGIFATLALLIGSVFFFVYISAFVEQFPIRRWARREESDDYEEEDFGQVFGRRRPMKRRGVALSERLDAFWARVPNFTLRFPWLVIVVNLAALGFFAWQLPKLQTTVTFHGMFPETARVIKDYNYLEDRIGGLIPIELVVNIPVGSNPEVNPTNELNLLYDVVAASSQVEGIESSLSALNFVPALPDPNETGFRAVGARSAFNSAFSARLGALREGCLFDDREIELDKEMNLPAARRWRVSFRVQAKSKLEYGPLLAKLRETANQTVADYQEFYELKDVSTIVTGGVPLAHKAQEQLLTDLIRSYGSAFVLILLALVVLLTGFGAGVIAMLPNILPSVLVFGAMAALGIKVDMGSMMTASVALGISVDATIHFLTWYRRGLSEGMTRQEATRFAYRECGAATTETTIICGGGMLAFAFSQFLPISRFAIMMAILLGVALYGSLIMFPAFLVAWTGWFFEPVGRRFKFGKKDKKEAPSLSKETGKDAPRRKG
ncbi:MAG: MMPL family transporter [Thermoguttaceae bacterium]|nr:MMPL family transporter [Thermoguttaceae bacterium]